MDGFAARLPDAQQFGAHLFGVGSREQKVDEQQQIRVWITPARATA